MWQGTHVNAYPTVLIAVQESDQLTSSEMYMCFLLQRDACGELLPPSESLLVGSLQTPHHLRLQDLQVQNVGLGCQLELVY